MSRTGTRNGSDYKSSMFFRLILLFSSSFAPLSRSLSETLLSPPKPWLHRTEVVYFFSKSSTLLLTLFVDLSIMIMFTESTVCQELC